MKKAMGGITSYSRDHLTITFDLAVCKHSANCTKRLPEVFDITKKPWVNLEGATIKKIMETIENCPSGALRYLLD